MVSRKWIIAAALVALPPYLCLHCGGKTETVQEPPQGHWCHEKLGLLDAAPDPVTPIDFYCEAGSVCSVNCNDMEYHCLYVPDVFLEQGTPHCGPDL